MNQVSLIGRLARDARETQAKTQSGDPLTIASFTLAVNRNAKEADFISCTAFGKTAELIIDRTHKGSKIGVAGRIQTGSYKNKSGDTVYTTDVIVERMEFCESLQEQDEDPEPEQPVEKAQAKASPQSRYTRENRR